MELIRTSEIIDWGKVMPKKAGMEAWKKKRRKEYLEKREFRYYIFCEGSADRAILL